MSVCDELRPLLAARPLGVLEPEEEERIDAHLAACGECPEWARELEATLELTVPKAAETSAAGAGVQAEKSWLAIQDAIAEDQAADARREELAVRVSLSCSFCHDGLTRVEAVFCAGCLAPHHADCFAQHGRCSALGCEETEVVRPGRPQPALQAPRWRKGLRVAALAFSTSAAAVALIVTSSALSDSLMYAPQPRPTPAPDLPEDPPLADAEELLRQAELSGVNDRDVTRQLVEHAASFIARGEHRLAVVLLDKALERDPSLVKAWVLRGRARHALGQLAQARADFDRAIALDSSRPSSYLARADLHLATGDVPAAVSDLSRALELDPGNAGLWAHRGKARLTSGDEEGAVQDLSQALRLNPRLLDALVQRGVARRAQGELDGALVDFDRAVALAPRDPVAYLERGTLRAAREEYDRAFQDLNTSIDIEPKAEAYMARALVRARRDDLQGAFVDVALGLRLDPSRDAASRETLERWTRTQGAQGALEGALNKVPDSPHLQFLRAALWYRAGDLYEAARSYARTVELSPDRADAWLALGQTRLKQGDLRGAVLALEQAARLTPDDPHVWELRAQTQLASGKTEEALANMRRALELDPQQASLWLTRGQAFQRLARLSEALEAYTRAIELDPRNATAFMARGTAYEALNDSASARVDYDFAIELQPKLAEAYLHRAKLSLSEGKLQAARSDLTRNLELSPGEQREADRLLAAIDQDAKQKAEAEDFPAALLRTLQKGARIRVRLRSGVVHTGRFDGFDEKFLRVIPEPSLDPLESLPIPLASVERLSRSPLKGDLR